jgi:hypothetical protein
LFAGKIEENETDESHSNGQETKHDEHGGVLSLSHETAWVRSAGGASQLE